MSTFISLCDEVKQCRWEIKNQNNEPPFQDERYPRESNANCRPDEQTVQAKEVRKCSWTKKIGIPHISKGASGKIGEEK